MALVDQIYRAEPGDGDVKTNSSGRGRLLLAHLRQQLAQGTIGSTGNASSIWSSDWMRFAFGLEGFPAQADYERLDTALKALCSDGGLIGSRVQTLGRDEKTNGRRQVAAPPHVLACPLDGSCFTHAEQVALSQQLRNIVADACGLSRQVVWCENDSMDENTNPPVPDCVASVTTDPWWAVRSIHALDAWDEGGTRGANVRIALLGGRPGEHSELGPNAFCRSSNDDGNVPSEPSHFATAIATIAVGSQSGQIVGAAPEATLVSFDASASFSTLRPITLARMLLQAGQEKCDIVLLPHRLPSSSVVHQAVRKLERNGVIVVCSAGESKVCEQDDTAHPEAPAAFDRSINVAGSTSRGTPWTSSRCGPDVDITAPAYGVWHAVLRSPHHKSDRISVSSSTAYAAALVAGSAALWLSHHGPENLISVARQHKCSLSDLYRACLRATARRSRSWDTSDYGAGILDAAALIRIDPQTVSLTDQKTSTRSEPEG